MTDRRFCHSTGSIGLPVALVMLLFVAAVRPSTAQDAVQAELKQRVEQLRVTGSLRVEGRAIRSVLPVATLYEARSFAPIWLAPARTEDMLRAIRAAAADGLLPDDYHLSALEAARVNGLSPAAAANLDLLQTDALLRLVHDTRFGKVDPGRYAAMERNPARISAELVTLTIRILDSGRITEGVAALRPDHYVYRGLMDALADLRRIEREGGWDAIPAGPAMRLGSVDPGVPAVRRRLVRSGDLAAASLSTDSLFDEALEAGLKRFQHRHALNEDGVLGPATRAELNVPVARRIEQVRVNLERARWVTQDLPTRFVVVNIAGAMVYLVQGSEVVFESRVIVGKAYTRTPIFRASMRYVDLNPTWTVPPGIVGEVLSDVRRDPGYLRRLDMRVIDRSGRPVDVSAGRLAGYTAATFPYVFRQEPGPLNPLGQVKLVFPNPFHVYLHDTPSRQLFEREERMFSHGCIRVQNPLRLAELVLDDPVRWNREAIDAVVRTGRTRTIMLAQPLPVLVLYWTASADLHGELHFYRDVYGRDEAVLAALGAG